MLDHEGPRITLLWVPSHVGIARNEKTDQAAKEALDQVISTTKRYPPVDLKKWLTEGDFKKRVQRWKNGNYEMKERKSDVDRKEDTKGMPKKYSEPGLRGPRPLFSFEVLNILFFSISFDWISSFNITIIFFIMMGLSLQIPFIFE
jgi:hypothetical protein